MNLMTKNAKYIQIFGYFKKLNLSMNIYLSLVSKYIQKNDLFGGAIAWQVPVPSPLPHVQRTESLAAGEMGPGTNV